MKNTMNQDQKMTSATLRAKRNYSIAKIIAHLHEIRDICRENKWYASGAYASMSAESLFHMQALGDKAQRPDFLVNLTDIHFSEYPDGDDVDEDGCI